MQQWQPRRDRSRRCRSRCRRLRWGRALVALAGLAVLLFGLVKLIGYGVDWISFRHTADNLKTIYQADFTEKLIPVTEAPSHTPAPAPEETPAWMSSITAAPTPSPIPRLPSVTYLDNPQLTVSSRFKALQKESKYIVGWLSIHRLLDEAVAQRDNIYYLDHDVMGTSNVNGALFLDAAISLKTRPYAYIIYGHNMKSGAMFGSLPSDCSRLFFTGLLFFCSPPAAAAFGHRRSLIAL